MSFYVYITVASDFCIHFTQHLLYLVCFCCLAGNYDSWVSETEIKDAGTHKTTFRMEQQFYVHLSSRDSMQYFPRNNTSRFTVKLPEILHLNGQWEVALCEIGLPKAKPQPKKLLVCSEICNESIIGEKRLPLLRVVTGKIPASFRTLQYIPVRPQDIERITLYIASATGAQVSFDQGECSCTLHFKNV